MKIDVLKQYREIKKMLEVIDEDGIWTMRIVQEFIAESLFTMGIDPEEMGKNLHLVIEDLKPAYDILVAYNKGAK